MSLKVLAAFCVGTGLFILYAASAEGSLWPLIAWLVVTGAGYVFSCWLHPRRDCWTCDGSGKHRGRIYTYASRACQACGGSGRRLRLGSRILGFDLEGPSRLRRWL